MSRKIDLTGKRISAGPFYMDVVCEAEPLVTAAGRKHTRWRCKCSCGRDFVATTQDIQAGDVTSCGCRKKKQGLLTRSKVIGQRFGNDDYWLTAIELVEEQNPRDLSRYRCKCSCGQETITSFGYLRGRPGKGKSCGCMPKKPKMDISGQVFGDEHYWVKALYLSEVPKSYNGVKKTTWHCVCCCGKEFDTTLHGLRTGDVTSCGCGQFRNSGKNKLDITGQRFGNDKSEVVALYEVSPQRMPGGQLKRMWHCRCKCGKEFDAALSNLTSGGTTSCGCQKHKERIDISGQVFGNSQYWVKALYEVEPIDHVNGNITRRYMCLCKCGTKFIVNMSHLTRGHTQSCGCLHSVGEMKISEALTSLGILFTKQKKFDSCRNPETGACLMFDFEIISTGLLIEFDGIQHKFATGGWNTQEKHAATVKRDKIKDSWCRENNKQLIRISYTELDYINENYILSLLRATQMEEDAELVCPT